MAVAWVKRWGWMMSAEDEARYQEILRRIEGRKWTAVDPTRQAKLASVLDGLNAMGVLDDLHRKRIPGINLYGPKAFKGIFPAGEAQKPAQWAGAVAWYKPRGYHHYRTLTLLGIWALESAGGIQVVIGQKSLEFDLPVFNPKSYYRNIKQGFELHFADDGSPPGADWLYSIVYDLGQRLAVRQAIVGELDKWRKQFRRSD